MARGGLPQNASIVFINAKDFMNPFLDNILVLAALAAVVDGEANEEEKRLIVDRLSSQLEVSRDDVRERLEQTVARVSDLARDPASAIDLARQALHSLPFNQQVLAYDIAKEAIDIDGIESDENTFIWDLFRAVFPESSGGTYRS
ncbi:hypothetical protein [Roseofilum casamattae]|uniref:Co-chaperone DjlA N-terminal domain-containing protein n=1 Tax=Roseofilum casamattae BLCC-M143 TaxID=3022442 RepID=A0ABT7BXM5_9CYAN|nr:hypothetical protein [Roseofilum casamattae]MDJ1183926.1 hypothetical protein [Roseofilum casamattae BLCC-M143]